MNNLITLDNIAIHQDAQGRYCLNDLHKASGRETRHRPNYWLDLSQTKELIAALDEDLGTNGLAGIPAILTKQGLGTYVCKELVYAYAMWVSAKFHLKVIRTFDAAVTNNTQSQPYTASKQEIRQNGKVERIGYTATLLAHGVAGPGFAWCTNSIYQGCFSMDAKDFREERGLKPNAIARESFSEFELMLTGVAEHVANFVIQEKNRQGNTQCAISSFQAAENISKSLPYGLFEAERRMLASPIPRKQTRLEFDGNQE